MIKIQVDQDIIRLTKDKFAADDRRDSSATLLASTMEGIAMDYPFRGNGYMPDADLSLANYVVKQLLKRKLAKSAFILTNTNTPLSTDGNQDNVY